MRKERRQLTRRELGQLTSRKPVVRRIPPPESSDNTPRNLSTEGDIPSSRTGAGPKILPGGVTGSSEVTATNNRNGGPRMYRPGEGGEHRLNARM